MNELRQTPDADADEYRVGDIFSVSETAGTFAMVKVLVVEEHMLHLCLYSQRFTARPKTITTSDLSVSRLDHGAGVGVLHIPVLLEDFRGWEPQLVAQTDVKDDQLVGYRLWKQAGGGVWS
ncbi:MAG: hypothetical protein ACRD1T_16300 [Acidimicrobiia bacterium]